jgi:cell division GTPase FtsZ
VPPAKQEKLALRMGVLGLGQAGGNLALEFHRRGYKALAVNTAQTDLRSLGSPDGGLPEEARLYIGLEGSDGAGKDPAYGRACLQEHATRITDEVNTRLDDPDLLVLCAGLGGGTGSCVADLWKPLEVLGLPMIALVTLPAAGESPVTKVNAIRAAQALVDVSLNGRLLVDNQRVQDLHPQADALTFYRQANASIVSTLDDLNRLNGRPDLRSLRSFDGEDLRRLLLSGAVVVPSVRKLKEGPLTTDSLESEVLSAVDGGDLFAQGVRPETVSHLAVVLCAPEDPLKGTKASALHALEERLKERTGGGAVSLGLYVTRGHDVTLHVVAATNGLPASVEDLLRDARREGERLSAKVQEDLPPLDASSLASMRLSRAPAPASLSRPPGRVSRTPGAALAAPRAAPPPPHPLSPEPEPEMTSQLEAPSREELSELPPLEDDPLVTNPSGHPHVSTSAPTPEEESHLQAFYEDMVARFRSAPDRKAKERVARRLIEDSRSEDEEVRGLAVWAMVALRERGFRRALHTASKDASAEVRKLAADGLEALGGLAPGAGGEEEP